MNVIVIKKVKSTKIKKRSSKWRFRCCKPSKKMASNPSAKTAIITHIDERRKDLLRKTFGTYFGEEALLSDNCGGDAGHWYVHGTTMRGELVIKRLRSGHNEHLRRNAR